MSLSSDNGHGFYDFQVLVENPSDLSSCVCLRKKSSLVQRQNASTNSFLFFFEDRQNKYRLGIKLKSRLLWTKLVTPSPLPPSLNGKVGSRRLQKEKKLLCTASRTFHLGSLYHGGYSWTCTSRVLFTIQ